ncbi:S8 family serine peptidase [Roseivirga misakiensis]|uniref:Peptidase S8/S53 domain-containing protein n=1 Tax=Roseivirga misakiensis TaxID=1563681 RepID=A0A1E5SZ50_9BACT|nr:S8 family serine peptidase [Roseivirga misakiensis]OEK04408.1 hypothetical protein BFP71_13085 [Roseivirga misakiensis]
MIYKLPDYKSLEVSEKVADYLGIKRNLLNTDDIIDWSKQIANLPKVWQQTKGEGIKIAILDSGITEHADFDGAIKGCVNYTREPDMTDNENHGTLIAGIVGARINNTGVLGVAPKCDLYIAKVMDANKNYDTEHVVQGLEWALKKDVDIVSISLGMTEYHQGIHDAIKDLVSANKHVICSAGNDRKLTFPASLPETIAVGSIGKYLISRSGYLGCGLDFVAPGVGLWSINRFARLHYIQSGTSFAAPFIAALSALILSKHRKTTSRTEVKDTADLKDHLKKMSLDLGGVGWDGIYGYGFPGHKSVQIESEFVSLLDPKDLTPKGYKKLMKYLSHT